MRLATRPRTPTRRTASGDAYGVQFHLEVSREMAREWAACPGVHRGDLERTLGPGSAVTGLFAEFDANEVRMRRGHRAGRISSQSSTPMSQPAAR